MFINTFHDDKENFSFNPYNNVQQASFKPTIPQLAFPNANVAKKSAKQQPKAKPTKNVPTNVRAGDWVCLVCNNLNFSFRDECNRCQKQTKKQNFIQSLLNIENPQEENSPVQRAPLKDVTNQPQFQNNNFKPCEVLTKHKSSPPQNASYFEQVTQTSSRNESQVKSQEAKKFIEPEASLNYGFENMLLVTPPKSKGARESMIFKEYIDSNQKVFPPYKSPEQLPSISEMLKRLMESGASQNEYLSSNTSGFLDNICLRGQSSGKAFEREECNGRHEDIQNPFKQFFKSNQMGGETLNFGSTDTSLDLKIDSSFHSIFEVNDGIQGQNADEYYFTNFTEDSSQKQQVKQRKQDWNCAKCGNLNYSFRKACNRCQVLRK